MKSNQMLDLSKIAGIEELKDFDAETYTGGGFRFAVSTVFSDTARIVRATSGSTITIPLRFEDNRIRLSDLDGGGLRFALAIHDRDTGANVAQIRSEANPASNDELITVQGTIDGLTAGNYEYRVRQIPPAASAIETNNAAGGLQNFFGSNSMYGA